MENRLGGIEQHIVVFLIVREEVIEIIERIRLNLSNLAKNVVTILFTVSRILNVMKNSELRRCILEKI